jgi:AcrR family transcriptional regulator
MGTTGRPGRPVAGDSALTRRRILKAARERFAKDGFRAATNRVISDDVGITTSALYHYFESKTELYAAVYCETIDEMYTAFEAAAAAETTLPSQFVAVLRRSCDLQRADSSITGFIVAVALETQRQPDLLALIAPQRGRHVRFFSELVDRAVERRELPAGVDREGLADLMGSLMTGLARTAAAAGDLGRYTAAVAVLEQLLTDERAVSRR